MAATARVLVVLLSTFAAVLLGACSEGDLIREAHPTTLAGTAWRAVEVGGRPTVAGSEPTLVFRTDQLIGSTGCNEFFGDYTYNPSTGNIAIRVTGMTAAACGEPARSEIEAAYVQALARVSSASIDPAGRLVLSGSGVEVLLVVDAVPGRSPAV